MLIEKFPIEMRRMKMMTDRANAICLLEILREYSDEDHILAMRDIIQKMNTLYDLQPDRIIRLYYVI